MRNDLYVTLEKGEFEKGGKSVARNVEITVYVLDIEGQVMKVRSSIPYGFSHYRHECAFNFRRCVVVT
jgi:hypothetical protein